jgi:hypothetical protein
MARPLERELATFDRLLPTLKEKEGKYVLIFGDEMVDIFETYPEALLAGYQKSKFGPFLVKKILRVTPEAYFSRDFEGTWPTSPSQLDPSAR